MLLTSTAGQAQEASAQNGEFSVQRFEPVAGPKNFLTVAGARMSGDLTWSAGMMFDYQRDPFVVRSCVSDTDCSDPNASSPEDVAVVADMFTWNVMGSLTPVEWVQIGLRVPVAYVTGAGIDLETGGAADEGLSGAGLGDMNLEGKFRVYGEPDDMLVIGAAADLSAPLGHATGSGKYIGNETPLAGGIRAIMDLKLDDLSIAANLRGVFKKNASLGDTTLGPEFRWGAAAGYLVHPLFRPFVEGFGSTTFSTNNGANAVEIDGGLQILPLDGRLIITVAGGTGVLQGIGVPVARGIAGITFAYDGVDDEDEDGVPDADDQCPTDAEDRDNVEDADGCPEDDADHDNIPDEVDGCPLDAETENLFEDDDGCPDSVSDSDGDGVFDEKDKCPNEKGGMRRPEFLGCADDDQDGVANKADRCKGEQEDTDGFEDLDGCPDPDNDGDGVPDLMDECADEKENKNGIDDSDGCPDFGPDKDGDGIGDADDKCVDQPERLNGVADRDGCPDFGGAELAKVNPKRIEAITPIAFGADGKPTAQANKTLGAIAAGLQNWAGIRKVAVVVTAADPKVAQARAEAVVAKLVAAGVAAARLTASGQAGADGVKLSVVESPRWAEP
jgi:OmpA-OmpF porin, OOP family